MNAVIVVAEEESESSEAFPYHIADGVCVCVFLSEYVKKKENGRKRTNRPFCPQV